jgi:LPXTG-site transpeptidase (sortase) family protein
MAVLLFVFGVGVGVLQLNTNQKAEAQVRTLAAHAEANDGSLDGGAPSEAKPEGDIASYRVSPASPRVIAIPKIGVEARVLSLGVTSDNALKSPSNIHDAGWYNGSATPGELGAVLINGHVHGPTKPGVFYNLKKLEEGDKITVTRGDGKVFTYSVVKSQSYTKDNVDMGAAFNSATPGKPGLNLITCDGSYDGEGNYDKRLIVFAVQD